MSSESFDVMANSQTAALEANQEQIVAAVGREMPPASAEQVRATDVVFARQGDDSGAGLVGAWAAGMLIHEIIGDHLKRDEIEEEDEERKKKAKDE
ncbi:MAG: hypothetical protein FJ271_16600 [Planctomycetes bacterium]|nr:hypothetical protein [Planctomycetota bacterium]